MAKNKTVETHVDPIEFIASYVDGEQKKKDSLQLVELMSQWSGHPPKMWGPTIIGFGRYHYTYASGHEGEAPLIGFSPRKSQFSLYVYSKSAKSDQLLLQLGKFTMGKSCIYVKKLADIDLKVLKNLCMISIAYLEKHHECAARTEK